MMPRTRWFVAGCCLVLFANACGDTTTNNGDSETPDTSSTATGSGGSATNGTTSTATTSATNGTGGTTSNVCPGFEPAEGSSCPADGQVCAFENCQAPDYRDHHTFTCLDGAWRLTLASACPFEGCPTPPPAVGQGCDVSVTPGPCDGVDACSETYQVVCVNGVWQSTDDEDSGARPGATATSGSAGTGNDPAPPVCPAEPPLYLNPCCPAWLPERCDYTGTGTDGAAGASFIVLPDTATTGGGFEPPPTLDCAVCTDQQIWDYCPAE